ncbi:SUMO-activating enzyme subunit 2 [Toxorhynchites rutilus septentrionalis]|uniref:SUMO-activating enzyme subunit 2 n=1 Tax=Toxorhynchites rutilus septentrionalis TaxID=329112 RepID=UPI00247A633B|nr:SUMO-activating enzyme subunit 2 [Toxorhynchites rutilus septentrionalis]
MAAQLAGVFEPNLQEKIANSKILVVGAGGIGCEILKNLVLSGFQDIEIIDLDTIDVSNLNRQFLFHKEHVGKSKANVARESALSFNPDVKIKAYHDSVTTTNYGVSFFKQFKLVLNALDNRAARNHVNRLCLTADVPLIESGTAGYNGQVELIKRGMTQCYECTPKAAQKTFPGCTIRNTPSEPIHCIVWAKHLFNQLFGESNEDEDVSPDTADPEAGAEAGESALAAEANDKGNVDRVNTRTWAQQCGYDPEKIFNKLFYDDINYLLSMSNLWKSRTPPNPAMWNALEDNPEKAPIDTVLRDQKVLSLAESAKVFAESIGALKNDFAKLADGDHLVWDKDDKHAMDFVAACANIRAQIFNIPRKSRFEIKSMAGNIIPAIATTNAITAGVVVMHAFRVLKEEFDKCQSVYMRLRPNARNQLFVPDRALNPPNPKCYVCAAKPEVTLKVDTKVVTVQELRNDILIKALNMIDPDVIIDGKGTIVISSEEGETDCNNDKKLCDLHIVDGCILKVDDFVQNYELTVTIIHKDAARDEANFEIIADPDSLKPKEDEEKNADGTEPSTSGQNGNGKAPAAAANGAANDDDDDDMCIVEDESEKQGESDVGAGPSSSFTEKRKIEEIEGPSSKKARVSAADNDDEPIVIN